MTPAATTPALDAEQRPAPTDPFRLEWCPGCGYSLTGLPERGVCPECGRAYAPGRIVLHGWARGLHANLTNASPRHVGLYVGLISLSLLQVPLQMRQGYVTLAVFIAASTAFAIGYPLWWRFTRRGPGLVQVHLTPAGCAQVNAPRAGAEPPRIKPWSGIREVLLAPARAGTYRLRLRTRFRWTHHIAVDAEIECTPERAEALRKQIEGWRTEGSGAGVMPP